MKAIGLSFRGEVKAVLTKANGENITVQKRNVIVSNGIDLICDALCLEDRPALANFIAIGSGKSQADVTDTKLENEIARLRASYRHDPGTSSFTLSADFKDLIDGDIICEAGVFNAANSGCMFNHVVFDPVTKENGDSLELVFTFTVTPDILNSTATE